MTARGFRRMNFGLRTPYLIDTFSWPGQAFAFSGNKTNSEILSVQYLSAWIASHLTLRLTKSFLFSIAVRTDCANLQLQLVCWASMEIAPLTDIFKPDVFTTSITYNVPTLLCSSVVLFLLRYLFSSEVAAISTRRSNMRYLSGIIHWFSLKTALTNLFLKRISIQYIRRLSTIESLHIEKSLLIFSPLLRICAYVLLFIRL